MPSFVFDQVKKFAATGSLNLSVGPYKVALLDKTIVDSPQLFSGSTVWSDISKYEILSTGNYEQKILTNVGVSPVVDVNGDSTSDYIAYADDVVYNVSTISASCFVIVKSSSRYGGINPTDVLYFAVDIRKNDSPAVSNNGVFRLAINKQSGGFAQLT